MSARAPTLAVFTLAFGAAHAGLVIAYLPLIVLLLPLKAAAIAPENTLELLSYTLLAGALTASVAGIVAGWISDQIFAKTNSRIGQSVFGLAATLVSYWLFDRASTNAQLIGAFIVFQICLNILFSPLWTLLADKVPNSAKARAAAIVNLGIPIGTLAIGLLALLPLEDQTDKLMVIGCLVVTLVTPVFFIADRQENLEEPTHISNAATLQERSPVYDLSMAWIARLCLQISGAVAFGYLLLFLTDVVGIDPDRADLSAQQLLGQMGLIASPIAIIACLTIGFAGDRRPHRRGTIMILCACAVGCALGAMAIWPNAGLIIVAYATFTAALTAYLAMDNAIVAQLLAASKARARTLGIMNLTNTIPSILTPSLALLLVTQSLSKSVLIFLFAMAGVLALLAAVAASQIRAAHRKPL